MSDNSSADIRTTAPPEPASTPEAAQGPQPQKSKRLLYTVLSMAVVFVVLLGVLFWQLFIGPQREAQNILDGISDNSGSITAVNSSMMVFEGQKIAQANSEQKGLAIGEELTDPPAFIFTNGKDIENRKVLDFYFDFSDQRSRDALIFNANNLKSLVESGQIELRLHALFGGKAYSMYAAEALSEVFAANTDLAWDSLLTLLRNSPALLETDDNGELVAGIVSTLTAVGVTEVDSESIQNGTFASWLLSIGNDPELNTATALSLPHVVFDGKELNLSADQLNDPDAFRKAITRELD